MRDQSRCANMLASMAIFSAFLMMALIIGGRLFGQEFRPDKDYSPNDFEKTLIDRIKMAAKPDTNAMMFIYRMSPAIEDACKALDNPTPRAIDSIMEYAGGCHRVIFRESMEKLQADTSMIADVMACMPQQGHFAVKTVELPKGTYLIVYWSDIAKTWLRGKCGSGYGGAIYPGDPDFFRIGLSARIDSDSLKYILYRGTSSLIIPTDSIVKTVSFATAHDSFDVSVEFEKKRFDIWTLNLYSLNRTTERYDLIGIAIPACVIDGPPRPRKK